MIVCPNCNHSNPDGAQTCEACYTPLPATTNCPSCGATVQTDASFCGQCGTKLKSSSTSASGADITPQPLAAPSGDPLGELERLVTITEVTQPLSSTNQLEEAPTQPLKVVKPQPSTSPTPPPPTPPAPVMINEPDTTTPDSGSANFGQQPPQQPSKPLVSSNSSTQLQQQSARLLHVQTNSVVELPTNLSVIHIGKQNDRIPPDIDVSGFPNSEIVSRVHADIRVEGDAYYIEDVGSSNGTYINSRPLLPGDRHRLRPGDRISLGKGDLVSFIVQMS